MKQILIVTDAWMPQINGVVTTMREMKSQLEQRGYCVRVIHPGIFKTIPLPGYKEIRIAINPWMLAGLVGKPDSIHIVTEGPLGIAAKLLCLAKGWKYTTGYHTNFPEYLHNTYHIPQILTRTYFKWFHQGSSAVFAPSKTTADKLTKQGFKNLVVWSRGFNKYIFKPRRPSLLLMPQDKINLLYVGRLSKEKNIDAFLALSEIFECRLWVVGDGPDRARLEKLGNATFVGLKTGTELAKYYASADVFVFPSKTDTLGIVSIEAMACGTPVAAYNVEGPRDVVVEGVGGALDDDLSKAVERAIKLKGNQSVLKNAAKYSWDTAATTFIDKLTEIQNERR
jgi:glycosyltransferase involved in cell wall biosynthesis